MKKLKIYLDTSVLNFMYAVEDIEKMVATKKFFNEIKKERYHSFISEVVIREINDAPEPKRTKLLGLVDRYGLKILRIEEGCEQLADKYVGERIIPLKYRDDAVHIAVAVINNMDIVVSWNLQHMVKLKTIQGVNTINKKLGYREIDIRTPMEVLP